ncbi:Arabinose metabolism transcriptional repressor [Anatilimnocola aggregata]|uniref:Arabinose metabolism transcriptional repressor n=1 Tax=Anatilimnocola aggregata TaxID=2528021 RepID=A0A517YIV1_9BACT|nr:GntR family transcriptional regulator [Anatilimnocola aggregata]QDU30163.1 Arabinose metabolism transcriptional repressor [Anatilimnocola aggregata]
MPKNPSIPTNASPSLARLDRPLSLSAQVERLLRQSITEGRFAGGKLPTEVELAEQLGVSRETVRLAAEVLQREGLLVKIRRKGTFTQQQPAEMQLRGPESTVLGFLQATYPAPQGAEEAVTSEINALMLHGAVAEAGQAGWELFVRDAPSTQMRPAFQRLKSKAILSGLIFTSFGEEKLLRRVMGLGIPVVLLDHDARVPQISAVCEDSTGAARQAVEYLAGLGHRRIATAYWRRTDLNPWRLEGYRQGMREAGLPRKRQWELATELTERGAKLLTKQFLEISPRPTALYCFNNTLAKRVIENLQTQGLRVPDDVSVLGGGGENVYGLTCHQAEWHSMGRKAVQILLEHVSAKQPREPEIHLFPHSLRFGQTTSPPQ